MRLSINDFSELGVLHRICTEFGHILGTRVIVGVGEAMRIGKIGCVHLNLGCHSVHFLQIGINAIITHDLNVSTYKFTVINGVHLILNVLLKLE